MKQMILTAVAATALALSPMAGTPARAADTGDLLGAVLGIAAIAAIANSIGNDRDRAGNRVVRRNEPGRGGRQDGRHRSRVLPGQCLRVAEGRRDDRIVFPEQCLNNAGIRDRDLPNRCERQIRTRNGRLDVYGARCLADAGWSLPRIATRR